MSPKQSPLDSQLLDAVKAGDDPLVRHLLYLGADIHTSDPENSLPSDAPLALALQQNNFSMVKTLLQFGADKQIIFEQALLSVVQDGDLRAFIALVVHGAQITDNIIAQAQSHKHILDWISSQQKV